MSARVYSVPGQTEGRRRGLFGGKLSLTCEDNGNYYKSVNHPIPTLPLGIRITQDIQGYPKQISKFSFQLSVQVCSLLSQSEGERKALFGGCKKEGHIVRLLPESTWLS